MDETAAELSKKMSATCGIPVRVSWSFRLFRLVCSRVDGQPLTKRMQEAFERFLGSEANARPGMSIR
ncbi:MAG TPA: hypothetical protein DIW46_01895 [Microbacterium sp.]|nr:hypothetical protein [Microbacterium sp.]